MNTYQICHCGYPQNKHNFRHIYEGLYNIQIDEKGSCHIDANIFPSKEGLKCKEPQCNGIKVLHETDIIHHPFNPDTYREFKFSLPVSLVCAKGGCELTLGKHKQCQTHIFETILNVSNRKETDRISVFNPEDLNMKVKITFV